MDKIIAINFNDYTIGSSDGGPGLPFLGHSGVLLIKSKKGLTKYFEYGRYDPTKLGIVKKREIPNISIVDPKNTSLKEVLRKISYISGDEGDITSAIVEVDGGFKKAHAFCTRREADNSNVHRDPYDLVTRNCMHFVKDSISVTGKQVPSMIDPRPNSDIDELRDVYTNMNYSYKGGTLEITPV